MTIDCGFEDVRNPMTFRNIWKEARHQLNRKEGFLFSLNTIVLTQSML